LEARTEDTLRFAELTGERPMIEKHSPAKAEAYAHGQRESGISRGADNG
jgi:hypothetical protein